MKFSKEACLKGYIIRLYRHDKDKPRKFVGTVEEPHLKQKKAFTNFDELWEILNPGDLQDFGDGLPYAKNWNEDGG